MTNLIGQSLGRYHILEQLGEGGMAVVYKAYDTRLETDVAVKVIRTENLAPSVLERSLKRFEREAKALARLTHPNIVKVIDYGEYEGKPYLVMPYLRGGTLKQKLGKPIAWRAAARFLIPVAQALWYAHTQNLIHRDVKPANILLTETGQPMVSDFGVAKLFDMDETTGLTNTGMGVGTPEYMAPEQWQGQVSPQTDVYALGVVLYEMITGRRPYSADTPAALLLKQANDPLPRPKSFVPGLPEVVERVLLKALAKKPEDRYLDMDTFANTLEGLLAEKPAVESPPPPRPVSENTTVQDLKIGMPSQGSSGSVQPRRSLIWLLRSVRAWIALIILVMVFLTSVNIFPTRAPTIKFTSSAVVTSSAIATPRAMYTSMASATFTPTTISIPILPTETPPETFTPFIIIEPTPIFAQINSPDGGGAFVRKSPGGEYLLTLSNGFIIEILGETEERMGVIWVKIAVERNGERVDGWIIQTLLATATPVINWESTETLVPSP